MRNQQINKPHKKGPMTWHKWGKCTKIDSVGEKIDDYTEKAQTYKRVKRVLLHCLRVYCLCVFLL